MQAVLCRQPVPRIVQLPNGHVYRFEVKNKVSLVYVEDEDVNTILSMKATGCNCSGGLPVDRYKLASSSAISVWNTGHY